MNIHLPITVILCALMPYSALSQDLTYHADNGQSRELQNADINECLRLAVDSSGHDPFAALENTPVSFFKRGGFVKGANGESIIPLIESPSERARAVIGDSINLASLLRHNERVRQKRAEIKAKARNSIANTTTDVRQKNLQASLNATNARYQRDYAGCLEERGYTKN